MKLFTKTGVAIVCLMALAGSVVAQEASSTKDFKPFSIGIKGGLNYSTIRGFEMTDDEIEFDGLGYRTGFHVGLMWQYMFTKNMGIESGLYYSQLGGLTEEKFSFAQYEAKYKVELSPAYIQMPVLFIYKFQFTKDFSLYPSGGLYLGYGVGGKYEVVASINGQTETTDGGFFGKENDANKFDMGLSMGVNLEYKKILLGLGVESGFLKINKTASINNDDVHLFNNNLKLSVGYLF